VQLCSIDNIDLLPRLRSGNTVDNALALRSLTSIGDFQLQG